MTSQVLIASYHKDFPWLEHCLKSLRLQSKGFLPPVVAVSRADLDGARRLAADVFPETQVKVKDGHGFLRAQIAMMQGDLLCPEADVVFLLGSDCFALRPFSPEPFFKDGKPEMLYTPHALITKYYGFELPWREGTFQILGTKPEFEFMRRLPLLYPKELFAPFRSFVERFHGAAFDDIIYESEPRGNCSESNLMGAWAWQYARHLYAWTRTDEPGFTEIQNPILQCWSHGGLDRPCDKAADYCGGSTRGKTAREVFNDVYSNFAGGAEQLQAS